MAPLSEHNHLKHLKHLKQWFTRLLRCDEGICLWHPWRSSHVEVAVVRDMLVQFIWSDVPLRFWFLQVCAVLVPKRVVHSLVAFRGVPAARSGVPFLAFLFASRCPVVVADGRMMFGVPWRSGMRCELARRSGVPGGPEDLRVLPAVGC